MDVTRGMKGVKKGRAPGWDEMRADMVAGDIGAWWTKRLLNTRMKQCKVPEDWRTWLIVPIWKNEMRCTRPREVQRNNSAESYYEITREDSGQEVAWERWARNRRGTARLQKRTRDHCWDVLTIRQLVEKRLERQGHMTLAFVDLEKAFDTRNSEMGGGTRIRSKNGWSNEWEHQRKSSI